MLVPTRELAVQVSEVLEPVANHGGQRILAVYGGSSRQHQVERLGEGVEIVVATPLRLIDLLKAGDISLADVDVVVLDEADRMADDGFTPQVEWVLRHCTGRTQTMLFSATLDGDVGHIIRRYLTDPVEVAIDSATDTVGTMHHLFLAVHHMDKDRVVGAIGQSIPKLLLFCQTKRSCDRVAHSLADLGIAAEAIHGDLPQPVRERVLHKFADGSLPILVATDVAARGIDIDDIGAVIHYEPAPRTPRTTSTGPGARPAPGATVGRSRSSSTTSTPRCACSSAVSSCRSRRRSRCSATTSDCATSTTSATVSSTARSRSSPTEAAAASIHQSGEVSCQTPARNLPRRLIGTDLPQMSGVTPARRVVCPRSR